MTARDQFFASGTLAGGDSATRLPSWIGSIGLRLAAWAKTSADYWEAAAMYEELAAHYDAELTRRGLSRATLAQYVRAACDRSGDT